MTRLVIAPNTDDTARPASTVRVGVERAGRVREREGRGEGGERAGERGERQQQADAEHDHDDRADRRARREAEQVRVGERVAGERLHDRAAEREPAPTAAAVSTRGIRSSHTMPSRSGREGRLADAEVREHARPHVGRAEAGRPDGDGDDDGCHEQHGRGPTAQAPVRRPVARRGRGDGAAASVTGPGRAGS